MVDFVKVITESQSIRNSELLEFEIIINTVTGEMKNYKVAHWFNLKFKSFDSGRLEISGSLHYFYNNCFGYGDQNHDQFTISKLRQTINYLCKELDLCAQRCNLVNLEVGVNIPYTNPQRVLNSLMVHRGVPFDRLNRGYYRQCQKRELIFKVYNKSAQFNLASGVLRVELKLIRSRQIIKYCGVDSLADFYNTKWIQQSIDALATFWNQTIVIDRAKQLQILKNKKGIWFDPIYWCRLNRMKRTREYTHYKNKIGLELKDDVALSISRTCYKLTLQE